MRIQSNKIRLLTSGYEIELFAEELAGQLTPEELTEVVRNFASNISIGKPKPTCEHDWSFCCGGSLGGTSINNDYICKKCGAVKKNLKPDQIGELPLNSPFIGEASIGLNDVISKLNELIRVYNKESQCPTH